MVHSFIKIRPTTAQIKDATSTSKKNYSSFADPNYHHSINVMSSCPHAAASVKWACVLCRQLQVLLSIVLVLSVVSSMCLEKSKQTY